MQVPVRTAIQIKNHKKITKLTLRCHGVVMLQLGTTNGLSSSLPARHPPKCCTPMTLPRANSSLAKSKRNTIAFSQQSGKGPSFANPSSVSLVRTDQGLQDSQEWFFNEKGMKGAYRETFAPTTRMDDRSAINLHTWLIPASSGLYYLLLACVRIPHPLRLGVSNGAGHPHAPDD